MIHLSQLYHPSIHQSTDKLSPYLHVNIPLVQQVSQVGGHAPRHDLQLIQLSLTGLQPVQVQDVLLAVGQLVNTRKSRQGGREAGLLTGELVWRSCTS